MLAALGVALAVTASAGATSGRLGLVTVSVGPAGARSEALAVAASSDGKIVAAGDAGSLSFDFALVRLTRNGAVDATFGLNGNVMTELGDLSSVASVVLQPDGKILAAGTSTSRTGGSTPVLVRYLPNGSLDASFGNGGIVTGSGAVVALQADGRIVTAQSSKLVRLLQDGSPDATFGPAPLPVGAAAKLAVLPDGKIVAAGAACSDTCQFQLVRFTSNGAVDPTFSNPVAGGYPTGLAAASDGSVIVAGVSGGAVGTPHLWRFRSDGSADPAFGDTPVAPAAVAVQKDGRIVVAGAAAQNVALARYRPNGSLDASFGRKGIVMTAGGHASALELQPDGRVVVAGATAASPSQFLVARYTTKGVLDRTFGPGCTVPKAIGLALGRARTRIKAAGCRTGTIARKPSKQAPGRVISQSPKPGTRVELGTRVRLVVSR
jgi:uncharacterized delta-60 repeat protein